MPSYTNPAPAPTAPPGMYPPALRGGQGCRVVVEGLRPGTHWPPLKDFFKQFGFVTRADVGPDGVGSVTYESPDGAIKALGASGQMVADAPVRVYLAAD
mmetsp:Transcript_30522/g.74904  ORF Transcript_30522/g.74904 Transcript_30522/m.74904 type:complete len:99 (-) Transcript_30522:64-360(-)